VTDRVAEPNPKTPPEQSGDAPRREPRSWFRPVLALVMVATASLGAAVAFLAAQGEENLAMVELRLTTGRMFEIARWVEYASQYATYSELAHQDQEHTARARRLAAQADAVRATDERAARDLDFRAEEEFALARIPWHFTSFLKYPSTDTKVSIADSLAGQVTTALTELGFGDGPLPAAGASAAPPPQPPQSDAPPADAALKPVLLGQVSLWQALDAAIDGLEGRVPHLAGTVVLFILALVLFTVADLVSRRYWFDIHLVSIGVAIAVGAAIMTLAIEPVSWKLILGICLFFAAYGYVAWWGGMFRGPAVPRETGHPTDPEPGSYRGSHLFLPPSEVGRSNLSIVLIAVTVLLSTGIGYLYNEASMTRQRLIHEAGRYQVALVERSSQASATIAAGVFDPAVGVLSAQVRCAAATQRRDLELLDVGLIDSVDPDRDALRRGADEACAPLDTGISGKVSDFLQNYQFETEPNGAKDIYVQLFSRMGEGPGRLFGMIDGYEQLSTVSQNKATVYLACLTLLAIAVYMFGQALGVGFDWQGKTFIGFGLVFAAMACLWASATWAGLDTWAETVWERVVSHDPVPPPPASCGTLPDAPEARIAYAAKHYQDGEAAYSVASIASDNEDSVALYREAAAELDCAVAARPLFAMAHVYRAKAYSAMSSPQRDTGYRSLPTKAKIRDIISAHVWAARSFQNSGLAIPENFTPENNSFEHLLLALLNGDADELGAAIKTLTRAAETDQAGGIGCASPVPKSQVRAHAAPRAVDYLNLGLALLIADRFDQAERIYKCAIDHFGAAGDTDLVVATLTDFNIFHSYCGNFKTLTAAHCDALWTEARKIESWLVAGNWREPVHASKTALHDVALWVTPAEVGWRARLDLDPATSATDKLTVVWYRLDPQSDGAADDQWQVWHGLPKLTKVIEVSQLKPGADGTTEWVVPYFERESECLAAGQYTAEFYINGALVRDLDLKPVALARFDTHRSRALNLKFCKPAQWRAASKWNTNLTVSINDEHDRFTAVLWTGYAPAGVGLDVLKAAGLRILLRGVARLSHRGIDDLSAHAVELTSCDAAIREDAVLFKAWTTSEGFFHIAISLASPGMKDACYALASVRTLLPPQTRTAATEPQTP